MTLGSITAKNLDLAACYGDSHSTAWPVTVFLALYVGDPASTGVELTVGVGGYDRLACDNDTIHFTVPSAGSQGNAIAFTFPACSAAWSGTPDHWAYLDAPSAGSVLDCGTTSAPIVTMLGVVVSFPSASLVVNA